MDTKVEAMVADLNNQVVTEEGWTRGDLKRVFDLVADEEDWKNSWTAAVDHKAVSIVCKASEFFLGSKTKILGIEPLTGRVILYSEGYVCW